MILRHFTKEEYPGEPRVLCKCDCGKEFVRFRKYVNSVREKYGFDACKSCVCRKRNSAICTKEYWTPENKKKLAESLGNSKAFREGRRKAMTGERNPMYGKSHREDTRKQMSVTRTGKKQSRKTVEKRANTIREKARNKPVGKSLNRSLKGYVHSQVQWYYRVFQRDGFKCVKCESREKIDAHHIEPFSKIIRRLLANTNLLSLQEQYDYLKAHPDILDVDLKNGMTLCRECHKKEHCWGSHNA